jgi:hypothetical protein
MIHCATAHLEESEPSVKRRQLAGRVLQALLLLVLIACAIKVSTGPKPWHSSNIKRITKEVPGLAAPETLTQPIGWLKSEIEHHKIFRAKEHGAIGLWYASLIGALLSGLLLVTSRWWIPQGHRELTPRAAAAEAAASPPSLLTTRVPLLLVIAAVVVGAGLRIAPLSHSLWNDEEYAMRRYTLGGPKEDGTYESLTWTETLFEQHNGNNHLLHSASPPTSQACSPFSSSRG